MPGRSWMQSVEDVMPGRSWTQSGPVTLEA